MPTPSPARWLTITTRCLFATYLAVSIQQAIPSREQRAALQAAADEEAASRASYNDDADEKWEFDLDKKAGGPSDSPAIPMTPMTPPPPMEPMTPRTQAYTQLSGGAVPHHRNRDLPLRHHIAMGDDVYGGGKAAKAGKAAKGKAALR